MKRRLIVLRHAKSAWDTDAPTDHERPLTKRGRRDAVAVGDRIAEIEWSPRQVVSSDSARTRETWKRMRTSFEYDAIEVRFTRDLYHAGIGAVRAELAKVPNAVSTVMVIGHNPGWEGVVDVLSGEDVAMTTCNAAMLSVEADSWAEAAALDSCWRLYRVVRPKEL